VEPPLRAAAVAATAFWRQNLPDDVIQRGATVAHRSSDGGATEDDEEEDEDNDEDDDEDEGEDEGERGRTREETEENGDEGGRGRGRRRRRMKEGRTKSEDAGL